MNARGHEAQAAQEGKGRSTARQSVPGNKEGKGRQATGVGSDAGKGGRMARGKQTAGKKRSSKSTANSTMAQAGSDEAVAESKEAEASTGKGRTRNNSTGKRGSSKSAANSTEAQAGSDTAAVVSDDESRDHSKRNDTTRHGDEDTATPQASPTAPPEEPVMCRLACPPYFDSWNCSTYEMPCIKGAGHVGWTMHE